jgi:hypothetical protein
MHTHTNTCVCVYTHLHKLQGLERQLPKHIRVTPRQHVPKVVDLRGIVRVGVSEQRCEPLEKKWRHTCKHGHNTHHARLSSRHNKHARDGGWVGSVTCHERSEACDSCRHPW